jgi:hypothetical protein
MIPKRKTVKKIEVMLMMTMQFMMIRVNTVMVNIRIKKKKILVHNPVTFTHSLAIFYFFYCEWVCESVWTFKKNQYNTQGCYTTDLKKKIFIQYKPQRKFYYNVMDGKSTQWDLWNSRPWRCGC